MVVLRVPNVLNWDFRLGREAGLLAITHRTSCDFPVPGHAEARMCLLEY